MAPAKTSGQKDSKYDHFQRPSDFFAPIQQKNAIVAHLFCQLSP